LTFRTALVDEFVTDLVDEACDRPSLTKAFVTDPVDESVTASR
jgi:hypothetical protein